MGKYMRKGKMSGEVAVMEVPGGALLGVRTRSRTLALQRAQRPLDKGDADDAAGQYLELRSRRLEKPHKDHQPLPLPPPAPAAKRGAGRKAASAAAAPHALAEDEVEVEVSFGENVLDLDAMERSTRETTPCSLIRNPEMISTPGSTTKSKTSNSTTSRRRMETSVCRFIPSSLEMEEFFSAAEQQEQHNFREKYNFCPVNDCPLPGRYEWARLDC
uniref:Cyclin-dependent kinase inhibitor n=1 Tax=Zea mays TaxID=4577 RepID=B6TSE9_MAIZE|nr:cyclin dependent kinase inhibitor [Zea mays]